MHTSHTSHTTRINVYQTCMHVHAPNMHTCICHTCTITHAHIHLTHTTHAPCTHLTHTQHTHNTHTHTQGLRGIIEERSSRATELEQEVEVLEGELSAAQEALRRAPSRTMRSLVERLRNQLAIKEKQHKGWEEEVGGWCVGVGVRGVRR